MATVTWIGGQSHHIDPNDATDPANWVGGIQPAPGDVVVVLAGSSTVPVTLDLASTLSNIAGVDTIDLQVGGPFDSINFTGVVINNSTLTAGSGTAANGGTSFLLLNGSATNLTATAGAFAQLAFNGDTIANLNASVGNSGTLTDKNSAVGTVQSNVTLAAGDNAVVNLNDVIIDGLRVTLGNHDVLNLKGSSATSTQFTQNNGQSSIIQAIAGGTLTINAGGTINSDATMWLDSHGGQTTINIGPLVNNGTTQTTPSFLTTSSALLVIGEGVTINADAIAGTRFSNNGFILVDGDPAAATLRLNARMNGISGEIDILGGAHGATLDVNTNMPGAQVINFGDNTGVLKIEAGTTLGSFANVGTIATTVLQNFTGRVSGFKIGNTIDLVGVSAAGLTYTYGNDPEYGSNILIVHRGATTVARLRMGGSDYVAGTGTADGSTTSSFALTTSGSDTLVTVIQQTAGGVTQTGTAATWNGVTTGGTVDWTSANWTGGNTAGLPGPYQTAEISLSSSEAAAVEASFGGVHDYVIAVTTAQTVGAVDFDSPFATLRVSAALTLQTLPGATNGASFGGHGGKVDIVAGGTISTSRMSVNGNADLNIDIGGVLLVSGVASFTLGSGLAGLDIEKFAQVQGGTIVSAGNIIVGANGNADFQVSNDITSTGTNSVTYGTHGASVSANYTAIGGPVLSGARAPLSTLNIQGPQTAYTDTGSTDSSTPLAGAMLVGGGGLQMNGLGQIQLSNGGNGQLNVMDGATLTDARFAMIGAGIGSTGTVNLLNGARWNIGSGSAVPATPLVFGDAIVGTQTLWSGPLPWLTVGANGTGSLNIDASVLQLGAGEAFNTPKMVIGAGNAAATGTVDVHNTGALLDTGGGPLVVGGRASGTLSVDFGGTVHVGAATGTTGFGFGLAIGQHSSGLVSMTGGALVDDADLVVGIDGAGSLALFNSASLQAGGNLYLGGLAARNDGTTIIASTLVKGSASGSVIVNAGTLAVLGNTIDIWQGSTLSLNGGDLALAGATAVAGELVIGAGGTLQGAGFINVNSSDSTLRNNGVIIAGGLTSDGSPSQNGATLEIAAVIAGSGTLAISPTATLQLDNSVSSASVVDFGAGNWSAGGTATLRDLAGQNFHATVADFFGVSESIDFVGASFQGAGSLTYTANSDATTGGTVNVNTGAGPIHFSVTGFHPNSFTVATDGTTGTLITANDAAPCFAAGTRITTATGKCPVESLRPGDLVVTATGATAEVVWLGHRRVDCRRHPKPHDVWPVQVSAGAFGAGVPGRDLRLSPDHAVYVDGVLIPIRYLINGCTVVQEPVVEVTYYHVELPNHGVLLAEGLPCESYLDTGNRGAFANGGGAMMMHPDFALDVWNKAACAELVVAGAHLEAAKSVLLARAEEMGWELTADPDLVVIVDGRTIAPSIRGKTWIVELPATVMNVRLVSRSWVPAHVGADNVDTRRLGVMLTNICLNGALLELDDPRLVSGWLAPEAGWRWTDGDAGLGLAGVGELRFDVVMTGKYWSTQEALSEAMTA